MLFIWAKGYVISVNVTYLSRGLIGHRSLEHPTILPLLTNNRRQRYHHGLMIDKGPVNVHSVEGNGQKGNL